MGADYSVVALTIERWIPWQERMLRIQGGRSRGEATRYPDKLRGVGKRLDWSKNVGSLIDRKRFVLTALKYFGILYLSVRKVMVLEGSTKGKHLVITCTLTMHSQEIPIHALINCGATGIAFMIKILITITRYYSRS